MGLFSGLKNYITGGGAKVTLECSGEAIRGEPMSVTVTAVIGETECKVSKVYLQIRGHERVEIPGVMVAARQGNEVRVDEQTCVRETTTLSTDVEVAGADTLKAGETYTWSVDITLPEDALPSYEGPSCLHRWQLCAGLDTRGNDPDSGWQDLTVY